jgi:hypothetical protein
VPPGGDRRDKAIGTGGYTRIDSLRTDSMYVKFWTLCKSISSSDLKAERTSVFSLVNTSGLVQRKYVVAVSVVAVVSEPAVVRRTLVSIISNSDIF